MNLPTSQAKSGTIWRWLFPLLMAAYGVVVLVAPAAPVLQDYPDWVYQGVLFSKVLARHPAAGYALHLYPVPNSLTTVGIGLLTLAAGWHLAAKLWICLVLAALALSSLHLCRTLGNRHFAVLPIFACSVLLGVDFWNGSINFQLGLALFLLTLASLLKPAVSSSHLSVLLLLSFFTHMLPCAAGLLALTAFAIQKRKWQLLFPAIPTLLSLAWYSLARDREAVPGPSPLHLLPALAAVGAVLLWLWQRSKITPGKPTARLSPQLFTAAPALLSVKFGTFIGTFGPVNVLPSFPREDRVIWRPELFHFSAALGIGTAILSAVLLVSMWNSLRRSNEQHPFLGCTSLGLALLFLLLPSDALGVTGIDVRFLHLALALGLFLLDSANSRLLLAAGLLASGVCCFGLCQFAAVAFDDSSVSLLRGAPLPLGTLPVAPAIRLDYYKDLQHERFNDWIFPTALFGNSKP